MADKILKELTLKIWRQKDVVGLKLTRFMIFQPVAHSLKCLTF